jgi:ABC-type uncharacterized transport system permease subunit
MNLYFATTLASATIAFAAPLLMAALGELISEKAGVLNIELEGIMLAGAVCGVWATFGSGSLALGFVGAALGGMLVALVQGVVCFGFRAEQVVSGVVLNILVLGLTTYGISAVFKSNLANSVPTLPDLPLPFLSGIPVLGPALFSHNVMVYITFLLVPLVAWLIDKTTTGLAIQAAGEHPVAAMSMGVDAQKVRWIVLLVCGLLAGMGGGQLTLAGLGTFTQNVTAGRGFIALAAVMFGRWKPAGTMGAILLFTFTEAVQIRAQVLGIHLPYQFLVMLPYLVTIVALTLFVRRGRPPKYLGVNL